MKEHEHIALRLLEDGFFSVDSSGEIWRNKSRTRTGREYAIAPIKANHLKADGYSVVRFGLEGRDYSVLAHRVVWMSAHGAIPDGYEINHKNGKRSDNRLANLELTTPSENTLHSYRELGRWRAKGELNGRSKLTADRVIEIRHRVAAGLSQRAASREFGVSRPVIKNIITGSSWDELPALSEVVR